MNSTIPSVFASRGLLGALVCWFAILTPSVSSAPAEEPSPSKPSVRAGVPIDAHLIDGSRIKMTLREETIEITTRYGKLTVPVVDIQKVDFATRIEESVQRQVDAAIGKLGNDDPSTREAGSAELFELRELAYPSLLVAVKSKDPEVARRAEDLIGRIRDKVPEERLRVRHDDVLHTDGMVITGRITAQSFRVGTVAFGDQQVKLSSLVAIGEKAAAQEVVNAMPDPGTVTKYNEQIGQTFAFTVTGNITGYVWGTDVYTTDSTLATAAVHAGVVANGQTKVVKVMILPNPGAFLGSTRNGVDSRPYGVYPAAFQFVR